jgi:hypothetical protein
LLIAIAACATSDSPLKLAPVRAEENGVFAGYINRVGDEAGSAFPGGIDGMEQREEESGVCWR